MSPGTDLKRKRKRHYHAKKDIKMTPVMSLRIIYTRSTRLKENALINIVNSIQVGNGKDF